MENGSRGYYRGQLPAEVTEPHPTTTHIVAGDARQLARQQGFTGDLCSNCGGVHMQVAGHCNVCADCGTTTGCS